MLNSNFFDAIAKQLSNSIPPQLNALKQDLEGNFKTILQGIFSKLDLVPREEFDVQVKLLQKAREKIDRLENEVNELIQSQHSDDKSER